MRVPESRPLCGDEVECLDQAVRSDPGRRPVPNARDIVDERTGGGVQPNFGGSVPGPAERP